MKNLWKRPEVKKRFDELNTFYTDTTTRTTKKFAEYYGELLSIIYKTTSLYEALILLKKECIKLSEELHDILVEEVEALYLLDSGEEEYNADIIWCDDGLSLRDRCNRVSANLLLKLKNCLFNYKKDKQKDTLINTLDKSILTAMNLLASISISELNNSQVLAILSTCNKYIYVAELDEKTCDICYQLNGKVFESAEAVSGINLPLMHTNCRCTITPYKGDL